MPKFPVDAPRARVITAFERLGFSIVRQRSHVTMRRANADGTITPLILPNHPRIKSVNIAHGLHSSRRRSRRVPRGV